MNLTSAQKDVESPDRPDSTVVLHELTVLGVDPEEFDDDFHLRELPVLLFISRLIVLTIS
jgi:hypothetical protein